MKSSIAFICIALLSIASFTSNAGEITLEKIFLKGTFSQKYVEGLKSMNDGMHYTVLESKDNQQEINKYDYENGKKTSTILKNSYKDKDGKSIEIESYKFSEDESLILLKTSSERIYRHSMRSLYYIYNTGDKTFKSIGKDKVQVVFFDIRNEFTIG
ncbi:MAG: hypothetical protein RIC15_02980 [Vicingaceae bacterium]